MMTIDKVILGLVREKSSLERKIGRVSLVRFVVVCGHVSRRILEVDFEILDISTTNILLSIMYTTYGKHNSAAKKTQSS
jgi:hypothetical protein